MKLNILDENGFYLVDHIEGPLPPNWTSDLVGHGYYKAQYQGAMRDAQTGEWTKGKWVETGGPSPDDLERARVSLMVATRHEKAARLSYASDMIGALSDEITGLAESSDTLPDRLRTDLTAWQQYRIKVKNIDISIASDIVWPASPEGIFTVAEK
ncbi:tail fiber assembly protein [Yersinia mollaretii]|uniref:tail fiber assembly protein n=1 Tax=Yersinia mollaretii TaxID=33060 RepID=UPI0011A267A8|nr:tail fiber assembly protein [Yersinia mollaretii]